MVTVKVKAERNSFLRLVASRVDERFAKMLERMIAQ